MKKIVGILAAAALIATSVFAADVSAQVRIAGDIFSYDGTAIDGKDGKAAGSFSMLRAATQSQPYWTPYITLSTSTDEAGAEVKFITGGDGSTDVSIDRSNVWFKPLDFLTVKAGFQGYNMNQEDIDWTNPTGAESWGYAVSYAQDAISANLFLITGNNGWFFQDKIAKYGNSESNAAKYAGSYINDLYFNLAYAADFGTISAMFEYQGKEITATNIRPDIVRFGAGYKNTIDALTFWADVVGTSYGSFSDDEVTAATAAMTNGKGWEKDDNWSKYKQPDTLSTDPVVAAAQQAAQTAFISDWTAKHTTAFYDDKGKSRTAFGMFIDGYVKYAQDALTARAYFKLNIADFGHLTDGDDGKKKADIMADNNFQLGLKARVDYKLDNGINLFAYFGSDNLLRKEFKNGNTSAKLWKNYNSVFVSTIKAGADGSVGILKYETYLQFNTGANVGQVQNVDKDTYNKWDKVKVSMPVTLTVAF